MIALKDEIHIHVLYFKGREPPSPQGDWRGRLAPEERRRLESLAPGRRGREFLWSRLFLRHLASAYLGQGPGGVRFGRHRGGKLFLRGAGPHFSLTHSGGIVACSFGQGRLGIDVELLRDGAADRARWELLARRFLSDRERRYIRSHPASRRSCAFLEAITLKEAYGKALGRGLAVLGDGPIPLPARKWRRWGSWEYITGYPVRPGYRLAHIAETLGRKGWRYRIFSWAGAVLERGLRGRGRPSFPKGSAIA